MLRHSHAFSPRPHRLLLGTAATVVTSLVLAAGAQATTYCVNFDPGDCAGTQKALIGPALTAAQSHAGRDTIKIAGGHIYDQAPFVDKANNPVDIVGSGSSSSRPLLGSSASSSKVLWVKNGSSTVKHVIIDVGGSDDIGLDFEGKTASDVGVQGSNVQNGATGVVLDHGTLSDSTVGLDHPSSGSSYAVEPDGDVTIKDTTLAADYGAFVGCCISDVTFRHDQITARIGAQLSQHGSATFDDSLIVVKGPGTTVSGGVLLFESTGGETTSVTVRGSTIFNQGSGTYGVEASASAGTAAVTLRNSIVRGFGSASLFATGAGAAITADYGDFGSLSGASGGTVTPGAHSVNIAPGFVNASGGDYHLTSGSPLIDVGDPAGLQAGEPDTDFYGKDRAVAAAGNECALRDIGAAEFQPASLFPPTAAAAASTTTPMIGESVDLDASQSCSAASMVTITSYAWSFDDGGSATGAQVAHAWATPGTHSATVTVTDSLGHTDMAVATINVQPGPPPDNHFTIGKPKLDKHAGTAKLPVTVPGAGKLKLKGKGLKSKSLAVDAAGEVKLAVKPKGNKKHKLKKHGKATVKAKVTFTPTGGTAKEKTKTVYLKRKT